MLRSIRAFLLINLLVGVTLVTSLAVVGNLFLEHQRFQTHMDAQLSLSAYNMQAFLDHHLSSDDFKNIQKHIDHIPDFMSELHYKMGNKERLNLLLRSIQFQVWDASDHLVLHSSTSAHVPLIHQNSMVGFDTIWQAGAPWRVFMVNTRSGFRIVMLQRNIFRIELEKQVTKDSLRVMLFVYPLLGLLIWVIVGRGLSSIADTARDIRSRSDPNRLDPLPNRQVPKEIQPLVDELNRLFLRLGEVFKREKRFAADAAHELRTPLAGISVQAQLAMHAKTEERRMKALKRLLKGVDHGIHVIDQLLTLSRTMPDASLQKPERVALVPLIHKAIESLKYLMDSRHIRIVLDVPKSVKVSGHKTALEIMLRNIVDNAIRYAPENTEVRVALEDREKDCVISVLDQGHGISDALKKRVFERFFRDVGVKEKGSGLGLGIVKQIVDFHGGKIELRNAGDAGGLLVEVTLQK
jgi:two-component system, OmpR family, sensor histidine kinase QseC